MFNSLASLCSLKAKKHHMRFITTSLIALALSSPTFAQNNDHDTGTAANGHEPIELVCAGSGSATRHDMNGFGAYGSNGTNISGWSGGTRSEGFGAEVGVRLFDGDDRIRLPAILLPPALYGPDR